MSERQNVSEHARYAIQIAGRIEPERAEWFGRLSITSGDTLGGSATTVLLGEVPDQAALFGILNQIRDLGLKLISVNRIEANPANCRQRDGNA